MSIKFRGASKLRRMRWTLDTANSYNKHGFYKQEGKHQASSFFFAPYFQRGRIWEFYVSKPSIATRVSFILDTARSLNSPTTSAPS